MTWVASPLRDRELLEMLAEEPELLAIADAIAVTAPGAPYSARRRHRFASPTLVAAAAVVAAAVALALLWPFAASSPSVLDNALAAIGSGPVAHVVVENNLGSSLLDVRTGKQTPASGRYSLWWDARYGLFAESSFLGTQEASFFVQETTRYGPQAEQDDFVLQYRNALRAHRYRFVGSGTYQGAPVYWLRGQPLLSGVTDEIAISKATYKPLLFRHLHDGKPIPGSSQRILSISTSDTGPQGLHQHGYRFPFGQAVGYSNGHVEYQPMTLAQAQAIRPPLLIPRVVAGQRLTVVARSPYTSGLSALQPLPGVLLYYGPLYNSGLPNDRQPGYSGGSWMQIAEFSSENAVTRGLRGHFRSDGRAVIDGLANQAHPQFGGSASPQLGSPILTAHTATLTAHGRYFLINAATRAEAIAAAREIAR
jgi:hypothetical protein